MPAKKAKVAPAAPRDGDEFSARREALGERLKEAGLNALVVASGPNLRYLSGFTGDNGTLLAMPDEAILFTDPRFEIQAAQEVNCRVNISTGSIVPDVAAVIVKLGLKRIGYEPARTTCETYGALKARLPGRMALAAAGGHVEALRIVKSPAEIDSIRRSVETNSKAFEQAVARVRPGMKEQDLAAELEYRMRRLGAEKPAFETIVAGGARSALPHAQPTAARLRAGDLVVVDMGAFEQGYASDMTRMLFLGTPGAKVKRMYRAVLEAQLAGIAAVRAGAATARVDAAARRVLKAHGLDRAFVHSTGHGLGLEIHEAPRLGKGDRARLSAGMAVTIEPGVYIEGFGGIRIEDTVAVTRNGCEILTPTSKDLRQI